MSMLLLGYFFALLLPLSCAGLLPWPLWGEEEEATTPKVPFFEKTDHKVVTKVHLALKEGVKLCGSDKWRKMQDRESRPVQTARPALERFNKRPKTISVVYSKPPCLPHQNIDHLGLCRDVFM